MPELLPYLNYIYAGLAVIVGLIIIISVFRSISGRSRGRKGMRLGIVEYCEIDQSRRLVLLRRDDVEHLVLIGGHQDLVVESRITTGLNQDQDDYIQRHDLRNAPMEDVIPIRPPRAPVFGAKRPPLRPVESRPREDDTPA